MAVLDQFAFAEGYGDAGDLGSRHSENVGQEFMGDWKLVLSHAIVKHEQPTGEPLFQQMKAVTGGGLRNFGQKETGITKHPVQ